MNEIDKYLRDGRKRGKKLDHYKMLQDIVALVETDFCADMEMRSVGGKYTHKESLEMSNLLGKVYLIAHCINCHACQIKYLNLYPRE